MTKVDILQGKLDMLILMTITHEPMHGFAIALRIRLNGVLTELVHLPIDLMEKISVRFKVLSDLVTYQTGLPQALSTRRFTGWSRRAGSRLSGE